jgi:hypothetical protein
VYVCILVCFPRPSTPFFSTLFSTLLSHPSLLLLSLCFLLYTYISNTPTYLYTYIPIHLHTYIPIYLIHLNTYLHTYIPIYLFCSASEKYAKKEKDDAFSRNLKLLFCFLGLQVSTHTYTHTHTRTHTNTHIHTHIH